MFTALITFNATEVGGETKTAIQCVEAYTTIDPGNGFKSFVAIDGNGEQRRFDLTNATAYLMNESGKTVATF